MNHSSRGLGSGAGSRWPEAALCRGVAWRVWEGEGWSPGWGGGWDSSSWGFRGARREALCAPSSAPSRGGYSLLTQTQVHICMLFISSPNEQEYREHLTPFPNRTTPDLLSAPAAGLSLSDLDIFPF